MAETFLQARNELRQRVRTLPPVARAAFAAACAERLVHAYAEHCAEVSKAPVLVEALSDAWALALGGDEPVVRRHLEAQWDEWKRTAIPKAGAAHHAALAILYAVRAVGARDVTDESAFHAADSVANAVIANVMGALGVTDYGSRYQDEVLGHPIVSQELEHQRRDILMLEGVSSDDWPNVLHTLRARAIEERTPLLPVPIRTEPHLNSFTGKRFPRT
jgi:hypothetical protein